MSLCETCAWRDEDVTEIGNSILLNEVCLYGRADYPHARQCAVYVPEQQEECHDE